MLNNFKNRLESVRRQGEQTCKDSDCIQDICADAMKEFEVYSSIIPEFFSYNNEALKIKALYKKLKELDFVRNRVISCVNIQRAGCLYTEYFTGMHEFIIKFIDEASSGNSSNLPLMEKQLQTAMQADKIFIDSLFGGKNNEVCEDKLTDAIQNVEYLVDFLSILKAMRDDIGDICCKASGVVTTYPYIINAVKLAVNSTCSLSNRIICGILDVYDAINNKLDDKPVTNTDNTLKVF